MSFFVFRLSPRPKHPALPLPSPSTLLPFPRAIHFFRSPTSSASAVSTSSLRYTLPFNSLRSQSTNQRRPILANARRLSHSVTLDDYLRGQRGRKTATLAITRRSQKTGRKQIDLPALLTKIST